MGDLGNDVNDDLLARTFSKYPSFLKARVIRDKWTKKAKGYGFVSFKDPHDFMQAMREMNGELENLLLCAYCCCIQLLLHATTTAHGVAHILAQRIKSSRAGTLSRALSLHNSMYDP